MKIIVEESGGRRHTIPIPLGMLPTAYLARQASLTRRQMAQLKRALKKSAREHRGEPFREVYAKQGDKVTILF